MVKMKALRSGNMGINGEYVRHGREFDAATPQRADELEVHGLAHRLKVKAAPPQNKMESPPENKAAAIGPFEKAGGTTGAAAPAPSSPPAPQRRRRRSTSSEDGLL